MSNPQQLGGPHIPQHQPSPSTAWVRAPCNSPVRASSAHQRPPRSRPRPREAVAPASSHRHLATTTALHHQPGHSRSAPPLSCRLTLVTKVAAVAARRDPGMRRRPQPNSSQPSTDNLRNLSLDALDVVKCASSARAMAPATAGRGAKSPLSPNCKTKGSSVISASATSPQNNPAGPRPRSHRLCAEPLQPGAAPRRRTHP